MDNQLILDTILGGVAIAVYLAAVVIAVKMIKWVFKNRR